MASTESQNVAGQPEVGYGATSEVRFAVVLYGGVSLAIYMYGIVSELLQLVRATAPTVPSGSALHVKDKSVDPKDDLRGAGHVYREMARRLDGATPVDDHHVVRTRFVVDLITGTSAGGINGIFLAKALANDQRIDALGNLWVDEGDIGRLLNDAQAGAGISGFVREASPQSVLSGQRMLFKLVAAMNEVSGTNPAVPAADGVPAANGVPAASPYVDALDLWVTATDLKGRADEIPLTDTGNTGAVFELNHRATFHFLYERSDSDVTGEDAPDAALPNMFGREYDPMLAFAARCTSSFPGAFEPVQLSDVVPVVRQLGINPEWSTDADHVKSFFESYGTASASYEHVSFADGGYLDNKPVDLVLNTLPKRRAALPVERKVLLIDPDPAAGPAPTGSLAPAPAIAGAPNSSDPVGRVDLVSTVIKVLSLPRSETIGGDVARILALEEPLEARREIYQKVDEELAKVVAAGDGTTAKRADITTGVDGLSSSAYWALRDYRTRSDLAESLARVGFSARSYGTDTSQYRLIANLLVDWQKQQKADATTLLGAIDLEYHLRRINFVERRIDETMRTVAGDPSAFGRCQDVRAQLDKQYQLIARAGRAVRRRNITSNSEGLAAVRTAVEQLRQALKDPANQGVAIAGIHAVVTAYAAYLGPRVAQVTTSVESDVLVSKPGQPSVDVTQWRSAWDHYAPYDQATLALQDLLPGENDRIQVYRVSPRDATMLVDERTYGMSKLAGAQVHHFGGFLDADWRRNDILWGQLDAAECVVRAVWPDKVGQDDYIRQAHRAIIDEALGDRDRRRLLARLLDLGDLPWPRPEGQARLDEVTDVIEGYAKYSPPAPPGRPEMVQLAGRIARVVDRIGLGLSEGANSVVTGVTGWVGRILRILAGIVDVALPDTTPSYYASHLVDLALVTSIVTIVLGSFTAKTAVVTFGWEVLGAGVAFKLVVEVLRAWMSHGRQVNLLVVAIAPVALAVYGTFTAHRFWFPLFGVLVGAAVLVAVISHRRVVLILLAASLLAFPAVAGFNHGRSDVAADLCAAAASTSRTGFAHGGRILAKGDDRFFVVTCPQSPASGSKSGSNG